MVFFILLLLLLISNGMHFTEAGSFNDNHLRKRNTVAVNGIFVIMVLFSHYSQYAQFEGVYDWPYLVLKDHIRQTVVASFLFYSGYGMMEAIRSKGSDYVNRLPVKFGRLIVRFWIALVPFLILNIALGIEYPLRRILLSFTLWEAIGNSSWYIFDILVLYILMYISFKISHGINGNHSNKMGLLLLIFLTLGFTWALVTSGKDTWWYNTLMVFPFGSFYSENKNKIESAIMKNGLTYAFAVCVVLGIYVFTLFRRENTLLMYTVWVISFVMLLLLFTMKVEIYNPVLEWLGQHVFSIYILQRLPMIVLYEMGFIDSHKYISLVVVIAMTLLLAIAFDSFTDRVLYRKQV